MKQVFVNSIHNDEAIKFGIAVVPQTIMEFLNAKYNASQIEKLLKSANNGQGGIFYFTNFCQYVVFVEIKTEPIFHGALKFFDCENKDDLALDQYLSYQEKGWNAQYLQKFMLEFQKIQSSKQKELAEMVIKVAFP